jgi:3-oxoacyl-[acyl-carrier-protein] synthase-1
VELLGRQSPSYPKERILLGNAAKIIARHFRNPNIPIVVSNACISGLCAQITAKRVLESGRYDKVIVCGADVQSRFTISGFQSLKALSIEECKPFDISRNGLNLGEAAATIIYGMTPDVTKEGGNRWNAVAGSIHNDAYHISTPSKDAEGCYRALRDVVSPGGEEIAFISTHGTSTLYNDEMESKALTRAGADHIPINSFKGYYGHTMGAAGVLETILSMRSWKIIRYWQLVVLIG